MVKFNQVFKNKKVVGISILIILLIIFSSVWFIAPQTIVGESTCPLYRTNAVNSRYNDKTVWLAVDLNNDGKLEGWNYYSASQFSSGRCIGTSLNIVTEDGWAIYSYNKYPVLCKNVNGKSVNYKFVRPSSTSRRN